MEDLYEITLTVEMSVVVDARGATKDQAVEKAKKAIQERLLLNITDLHLVNVESMDTTGPEVALDDVCFVEE
jgi:hypothetical protein